MSWPQKSQDPLEVLQLMVNDVLVQTGKALRASRKDGPGNIAQAHGSLQSKLPETVRTFHGALDDLENDILRAKSALLRDLNELRNTREYSAQAPEPVEAQSKSAMVIDLDSSPISCPANQAMVDATEKRKPVAPVPDMGMGLADAAQMGASVNEKLAPAAPAISAAEEPKVKSEVKPSPAPMAPMPSMGEASLGDNAGANPHNHDMANAELKFTDMEFTLAPTNESQNPPAGQEPSFDLTTFAPTDAHDDLLSFDNLLPQTSAEQPAAPAPVASAPPSSSFNPAIPAPQDTTASNAAKTEDKEGAKRDTTTFGDDLFNLDNATDGLDFDFDMDGNFGEETFDSLMEDRDDSYTMEHGDSDAAFFGLGKIE